MTAYHYACKTVIPLIGYIPANNISSSFVTNFLSTIKITSKQCNKSNSRPLTRLRCTKVGLSMRENLDHLSPTANNATEMLLTCLVHHAWMVFFLELCLNWSLPAASLIGGLLLDEMHKNCKRNGREGSGYQSKILSPRPQCLEKLKNCILSSHHSDQDL